MWIYALFCCLVVSARKAMLPFHRGDVVSVECKNFATGEWGPAVICGESGRPLEFRFQEDSFLNCKWPIESLPQLEWIGHVIKQEAAWPCRVPMSAETNPMYLPLSMPLWGVVEPDHVHLNIHFNFVFHQMQGIVIGATVYPVRDKMQLGKVGSVMNMHGPSRWFQQHSFTSADIAVDTLAHTMQSNRQAGFSALTLVMSCVCIALLTSLLSLVYYLFALKPALVRHLLKAE